MLAVRRRRPNGETVYRGSFEPGIRGFERQPEDRSDVHTLTLFVRAKSKREHSLQCTLTRTQELHKAILIKSYGWFRFHTSCLGRALRSDPHSTHDDTMIQPMAA